MMIAICTIIGTFVVAATGFGLGFLFLLVGEWALNDYAIDWEDRILMGAMGFFVTASALLGIGILGFFGYWVGESICGFFFG